MSGRPVGRIVGSHGLRGWIKVEPMTEFFERFQPGATLLLDDSEKKIEDVRLHKQQVRLKLDGVEDRNAADALRGKTLQVPIDSAPTVDEDEYLVEQIVGLIAVTSEGRRLGTITEVFQGAAHDLLSIDGVLVPMVAEFVKAIDLESGVVTIEPIEGMFSEEPGNVH